MEVDIPQRPSNAEHFGREEYKIAHQFAREIHKEMGKFLKGVILFGSSARKTQQVKSDIDVLILIDDMSIIVTRDVADAYRIVIEKMITNISRRLHVVTLRLSAFWEYIRNGDPIGINMLRDGIALFDTGFFEPLQLLLKKGRIRPTHESIWAYYSKAPVTLNNSKWHVLQATVDLYWAVIDAAHAALMSQNVVPPTPSHVSEMLDEHLVKKGLLEKKYSKTMKTFYNRAKGIMHREILDIKGAEFDKYLVEADQFVDRMKKFIPVNK